jgi:prophage regulatory protein
MTKLQASTPRRYLREPAILKIFPFSRPTLHRRVKDGTFPRPVKIAPHVNAWLEDEIEAYQAAVEARRDAV